MHMPLGFKVSQFFAVAALLGMHAGEAYLKCD